MICTFVYSVSSFIYYFFIFLYMAFSWSYLEVHSNGSYPDMLQAKAAGMAEGYITSEMISMAYVNQYKGYCDGESDFCDNLRKFVKENNDWMEEKIASSPSDDYWYQVI